MFPSGPLRLAGRLIAPAAAGPHPAVILVHGSGPQSRDAILPFARFLVRRGMAVLAYDKRGVGASSGDWTTASFDDLATDVVAAFEYLETRPDIERGQIGLLGWSQAGWVMPLAAVRRQGWAFLISISGPGIPAAETTMDHARHEMTSAGMPQAAVAGLLDLMQLQNTYARTGQGWEDYSTARAALAARMGGSPPETFPAAPDAPHWEMMRRMYFYDPAPTLRQLRVPVLALFGELDNNVVPDKNRAAWEKALQSGGHADYTLRVLSRANHALLEAQAGTNAEMKTLQRFVPAYSTTVEDWLRGRIRGFGASRGPAAPLSGP